MLNRIVAVAAVAAAGVLLSKKYRKSHSSDLESESTVEESIDIELPVEVAYNQWTQFEDFPKFMDNVHEVRQLDDRHLHWRAEVAGKEQEWDAEITEQIPDRRIAWRSISGAQSGGVVTFHKIADGKTRIMLQMDYTPRGVDEKIGDALGLMRMQAKRTLKRFKELLESRGRETGAWRGTVTQH